VLWRKFIRKKETLADYVEGIEWLEANKFKIEGIVSCVAFLAIQRVDG
jgi:hypothetical protein